MKRRLHGQPRRQQKLTSFFGVTSDDPPSIGEIGGSDRVHSSDNVTERVGDERSGIFATPATKRSKIIATVEQRNRNNSVTPVTPKSATKSSSKFAQCPMCERSFSIVGSPWSPLEQHASTCLGTEQTEVTGEEPKQGTNSSTEAAAVSTTAIEQCTDSRQYHTPISSVLFVPPPAPDCTTFPYYQPIPGLFVFENFITLEEELCIINGLDFQDHVKWKLSTFNGLSFGKRWGVHCNLRDRRVDAPTDPIPDFVQNTIVAKIMQLYKSHQSPANQGSRSCCTPLARLLEKHQFRPNEANAIDYRKPLNHWLKDHVDDRRLSKEPICNMSLCGDAIMTYRRMNNHKNRNCLQDVQSNVHRVLLKRRCLQILTGPARYDYTHGIAGEDILSDRRISITIRQSPLSTATSSAASNGSSNSISQYLTMSS